MRYVQRDKNGKLIGHFANEQTYAQELVPDDHPDVVAFDAAKGFSKPASEKRVAKLEAIVAKLTGGELK